MSFRVSLLISNLCLAVCLVSWTKATVNCPTNWIPSEESGTCLRLYTNKLSWFEAREACQGETGDLVKIINSEMNNLIAEFKPQYPDIIAAWIGLNDLEDEETWVWLDETTEPKYTHWVSGQPDGETRQNCAEIDYDDYDDAPWRDNPCETTHTAPYICEIPPIATTSTTTITTTTTSLALATTAENGKPSTSASETGQTEKLLATTKSLYSTATSATTEDTGPKEIETAEIEKGGLLSYGAIIAIAFAAFIVLLVFSVLLYLWVSKERRARALTPKPGAAETGAFENETYVALEGLSESWLGKV